MKTVIIKTAPFTGSNIRIDYSQLFLLKREALTHVVSSCKSSKTILCLIALFKCSRLLVNNFVHFDLAFYDILSRSESGTCNSKVSSTSTSMPDFSEIFTY